MSKCLIFYKFQDLENLYGESIFHLERTGNIMAQLKATDSNQAYMKFVNSTTGDCAFTDGLLFGLDTDESGVFWNYEATPLRFATVFWRALSLSAAILFS